MTARLRGFSALLLAGALLAGATVAHAAATFVIQNNDPAGVGFNDPTVVAPVGGNPGTTVGQQRMLAFQHAASLWGQRLTSSVTINVAATFGALACTTSSGVLGSAGPTSGAAFGGPFPNVPANTIVTVAEAEKLSNSNINGASAEIQAQFNGNVGKPGCLTSLSWYYGFDSNPPPGALDFVTVLMHELTHGLGFVTFVNLSTGAETSGLDDVFELNLRDNVTAPNTWTTMSNAQRVASAVNTNNVVWSGAAVTALPVTSGQDGAGRKLMYTPNPLQLGSSIAHWTQSAAGGSNCAACTDLVPIELMRPSYTVPTHRAPLAERALTDMGWGAIATPAIVVTTLTDEDNGYLGGGTGISLREAVNHSVAGDLVTFGVNGVITLTLGQLTIAHNLFIQGNAADTLKVNGNSATRVFQVNAGVTADITNLEIQNGHTFGFGTQGANVRNLGTLHLGNCTLSGGITESDGGAIYTVGALTVDHCLFLNNHADFDGAGIRIDAGTSTIDNCTFTGGTTGFSGAAVRNAGGSATLVRHCTMTGNAANLNGGAMEGNIQLRNSLVAGNTAGSGGPDIFGTITSQGYNLVGNASGASGFVGTDLLGVFQSLGPLDYYGGRTRMFPLGNGPAVNAIPLASCVLPDDQRGIARPQNGACDIGSFESTVTTGVGDANAPLALRIAPERNPSLRGALAVRFTLPAVGRAHVELFDIAGRQLAGQDLGALGAGEHRVELTGPSALRPGVYLVKLSQGVHATTTRVTVLD